MHKITFAININITVFCEPFGGHDHFTHKKQNMLYDQQRLAVTDQVNKNNIEFQLRNRAVAQQM